MKTRFKISVAQFPGGGTTRWETTHWFTKVYHQMMIDPLISDVVLRNYNDTPIYMTRNEAVDDALEAKSDYLMMIDSDMCPDLHERNAKPFWKTSWNFLMRRRLKERGADMSWEAWVKNRDRLDVDFPFMPATIAAPYCGPPPIENVYVFRWINYETGDPDGKFSLAQYSREEAALFEGISEVAALPTGLILFDTRQFEHVPVPWFDYEFTCKKKKKKASTEDVFYTRNASLGGFPQFCNWSSWAGHVKTKRVLKPHPIHVEDVAEMMRDAILQQRSRDQRVKFLGDPVEGPRPWAKSRPSEEAGFLLPGDFADDETRGLNAELEIIRLQNAAPQKDTDDETHRELRPDDRLQRGEPCPQAGPCLSGPRPHPEGDVAPELPADHVPLPEPWRHQARDLRCPEMAALESGEPVH